MNDIVWWANHVRNSRSLKDEPVPLNDEMLDQLTIEELKDYYEKIKHLSGVELWDSEAAFLYISDWNVIINSVQRKLFLITKILYKLCTLLRGVK